MAGVLQVYRRFYHISIANDLTTSYTLIDPTSLSAIVRNVTQGNLIVEASATIVHDSLGLYHALLDSSLYTSDDEYEISWEVQYVSAAPTRLLYTRFQFPMEDVVGSEGLVIRELDVEMDNGLPLEIAMQSRTLSYVIDGAMGSPNSSGSSSGQSNETAETGENGGPGGLGGI